MSHEPTGLRRARIRRGLFACAAALAAVWTGCAAPAQQVKPIPPAEEALVPPDLDALPVDPGRQSYVLNSGVPEYLLGPGDLLKLTLRDVDLARKDRSSVQYFPKGRLKTISPKKYRLLNAF